MLSSAIHDCCCAIGTREIDQLIRHKVSRAAKALQTNAIILLECLSANRVSANSDIRYETVRNAIEVAAVDCQCVSKRELLYRLDGFEAVQSRVEVVDGWSDRRVTLAANGAP